MNTKEVLSANEIQTKISLELNNLVKTSFKSADLPIDIVNLINSISELTNSILDRCEYIEESQNSERVHQHSDYIRSMVNQIKTLCKVSDSLIIMDDFGTVHNLIYHQKQLNELNPAPIQKMGLAKDETDFLTK